MNESQNSIVNNSINKDNKETINDRGDISYQEFQATYGNHANQLICFMNQLKNDMKKSNLEVVI